MACILAEGLRFWKRIGDTACPTLVTTSVYLPKDSLALPLNGSTKWPTAKELRKLGETRGGSTPAKARETLERIAEAIQETNSRSPPLFERASGV